MRKNWQEIFELIRDDMPTGVPVSWDEMATKYFDMVVPEWDGSAEWNHYVVLRGKYKEQVNKLCAAYRENWRLYSHMRGRSVMRREKSDMLQNETHDRLKYVAGSFRRMKTKLRPMSGADGMTAKDNRLINDMIDVANGANMAVAGMVQNLTSISTHEKRELLEQFGISSQPEL